jgi:hypothetical protein
MDLRFPDTGILFGFLIGKNWISRVDRSVSKTWSLFLFNTEKGRKLSMAYQARNYPGSDILTFEIKLSELVKISKLVSIIPPERQHLAYLEDVLKGHKITRGTLQ